MSIYPHYHINILFIFLGYFTECSTIWCNHCFSMVGQKAIIVQCHIWTLSNNSCFNVELSLFSLHYLDVLKSFGAWRSPNSWHAGLWLEIDTFFLLLILKLTHSLLKTSLVSHCNGRVPFNLQNPSMQARCFHFAIQIHHCILLTE